MLKRADILLRLVKAGLFALAFLVACVGIAPGAFAHGSGHAHSLPVYAGGPESPSVVTAPAGVPALAADAAVFVAAWDSDTHAGGPCPTGSHGHPGHTGCCAGSPGCSAACSAAMVLPDLPDLGPLKTFQPPLLATPLSVGLGSRPGEYPPKPFV